MNIVYHTYISLRYLLLQSYLYNLAICYRSLCHRLWHKGKTKLTFHKWQYLVCRCSLCIRRKFKSERVWIAANLLILTYGLG